MTQNQVAAPLILASQSPVRAALLHDAGIAFATMPAHVDEAGLIARNAGRAPDEIALALATAKAQTIAGDNPDAIVVGADQLLVHQGKILQKPGDLGEARARLELLSGSTHQLVTGVVLIKGEVRLFHHAETGRLTMHALSPAEIADALALDGEAVLQSVGAYRLEGPGIRLFAALEGDYFAMLGLPLVPLLGAIRRHAGPLFRGADAV